MRLPLIPHLDPTLPARIQAHLDDLAKPKRSLGRLESLALRLGWIAGTPRPEWPVAWLLTFAGDHGVVQQGVSAYPADVTAQMVANLAAGGAASSVLCRVNRVEQRVVDVGVAVPLDLPGVSQRKVLPGTADCTEGPAMTRAQAEACLQAGMEEAGSLPEAGFGLLAVGEMGIGNSTIAALLTCVFLGLPPEEAVGHGTGVDDAGLQRKVEAVRKALARHHPDPSDPVGVLAAVGGAEFGAMAGAMLAGASRGWGVVVDGYIAGAAALIALALEPALGDFLFWSHRSSEPGAGRILARLGVEPVLDLGLRLGEGSGAVLAIPVLRSACALAREMATFSGAGVSRPPDA